MNAKKVSLSLLGLIFRIVLAIVIVLVVYNVATSAYKFGYKVFAEKAMSEEPGTDVSVTIAKGESAMDIGKLLVDKGLIRDSKLFYVQAILFGKKDAFLPGDYTLNTSETAITMMDILSTEPTADASTSSGTSDTSTTGTDTSTDTTASDNTAVKNDSGAVTTDSGTATDTQNTGTETDQPAVGNGN